MAQQDYYQILGVPKSASASEIKKAYLKLAKEHHPDHNKGNAKAEQKFKEISAAYDVLKDEQKKAAYDNLGHQAFTQGGSSGPQGYYSNSSSFHSANVNDIFGDFFGDVMGTRAAGRRSSSQTRGSDLKYNISITLEEAFTGAKKNISFVTEVKCTSCDGKGSKDTAGFTNCSYCQGQGVIRRQQGFFALEQTCNQCGGVGKILRNPCPDCRGNGRYAKHKNLIVTIPGGVEHNMKIRIVGEGEAGIRGGSSGDLYVVVNFKPHDIFKTEGSDLHFRLPLKITTAALGGEVEIPTIEGAKVSLNIPAGTETGDKLKVSGKGMAKIRSTARGDLYAHAYIKMPKKWSKKEQELLEALDKELKKDEDDSGFFAKVKNIWS